MTYCSSPLAVLDVIWMSVQSVHLTKWMAALEQVIVRHLDKCPHQMDKASNFWLDGELWGVIFTHVSISWCNISLLLGST